MPFRGDSFIVHGSHLALSSLVVVMVASAQAPPAPDILTENSAAQWIAQAQGASATVTNAQTTAIVGESCLQFTTTGGFDTWLWTPGARNADWNLTGVTSFRFWAYAVNPHMFGFQNNSPKIRLGTGPGANNYYEYRRPTEDPLNAAIGNWVEFTIPIAGDTVWQRFTVGAPNLSNIDYVEIHADTWDFGFTLRLDGMAFDYPSTCPERWAASLTESPLAPQGRALLVHDFGDGDRLYVGGSFCEPSCGLVAWDGTEFYDIGGGIAGAEGGVNELIVYDGRLIVAGSFDHAGNQEANNIASWDPVNGWLALSSGTDAEIYALAVYDGKLIAGGEFYSAGGHSANHIAMWDGDTWNPMGSGVDGAVSAIAEFNNQVVAGGAFPTAGGQTVNSIARWNGSSWLPLGTGVMTPWTFTGYGWVLSLLVHHDSLIVGGTFDTAGGTTVNNIARWDGNTWHQLGSGMNWFIDDVYPVSVLSLTTHSNRLVAAGAFSHAGGVQARSIARWNGVSWAPLGTPQINGVGNFPGWFPLELSSWAGASAAFNDGMGQGPALYVAGIFQYAGDTPSPNLARWGCDQRVPHITSHPNDENLCSSSEAVLTVQASGSAPLTYQWRKNTEPIIDNSNIVGSTTSMLIIHSVSPDDEGSYDCVVSNDFGTDTSNQATLTASQAPSIIPVQDAIVYEASPYLSTAPQLLQGDPPITWNLSAGPTGALIHPETGVVSWPLPTAAGSPYAITIEATNPICPPAQVSWLLTVLPTPDLQVVECQIPASGFANSLIQATWSVSNTGDGATAGVWIDHIYRSPDDVFGGNDTLLTGNGAFYDAGLLAGESYPSPRVREVPLPSQVGFYWFFAKTDANSPGQIWEGFGESNNVTLCDANPSLPGMQPIQVLPQPLPDLVVTQIMPPTGQGGQNPLSGTTTEIEFTVQNIGTAPTPIPHWNDLLFISRQTNITWSGINGSDQIFCNLDPPSIGVPNAQSLAPGDSYTQTVEFDLPQDEAGEWHVYVLADRATGCHPGTVLVELNKENNILRVGPFQVDIAHQPDLVAENILFSPSSLFSGDNLAITWTDVNQGLGSTDCCGWWSQAYLSLNDSPLIDESQDIRLGDPRQCNTILEPESTHQCNPISRQIPVDLQGTFFVKIKTDITNHITELGYEDNNISVSSGMLEVFLAPPVNLIPTELVGPIQATPGHLINVTWSAQNVGFPPEFAATWQDTIYLSDDTQYQPGVDAALGSFPHSTVLLNGLPTLEPYTIVRLVRIPNAAAAGTKYLIVCVDANHVVFEGPNGDDDNCTSVPLTVIYSPTDLQPSVDPNFPIVESAAPGQSISVSWIVLNAGQSVTPVAGWQDRIYFSADQVVGSGDIVLATIQHTAPLDAGASYSVQHTTTCPFLTPGQYFIIVRTDFSNLVYEQSPFELNNDLVIPFTLTNNAADLIIADFDVPAEAESGSIVHFEWTERNAGTLSTSVATWIDRIYLSTDGSLGNDIELGARTSNGTLAPGETRHLSGDFFVSPSTSGLFHIIKCIDVTNAVFETNNSNNCVVKPIMLDIELAPPPDLIAVSIISAEMATSGQPLNVTWIVENVGLGAIPSSTWHDSVYLSLDQFFDLGVDRFLGHITRSGPLAPLASYSASSTFVIPNNVVGTHYVIIATDAGAQIFENGSEANNVMVDVSPVVIVAPPPSDLSVSNVIAPPASTLGYDGLFAWSVTNSGSNIVPGTWTDSVYLSSDAAWTIDDAHVDSFLRVGSPINPGESADVVQVASIPGVIPGDYYVFVRTDIFDQIPEFDNTNNLSVSVLPFHLEATPLVLGDVHEEVLPPGRNRFFALATGPNETIRINMTYSSGSWSELYVKYGSVPSIGDFHYVYQNPGQAEQTIIVPNSQAGTYYVLARVSYAPTGVGNVLTLTAETLPFELTNSEPSHVGADVVTLRVQGSQLQSDAQYKLVSDVTGNEYQPHATSLSDATTVRLTFDLRGATLGPYHLVAQRDTAISTLASAVILETPSSLALSVDVQGMSAVRKGTTGSGVFILTNTSNIDVPIATLNIGHLDATSGLEVGLPDLPPNMVIVEEGLFGALKRRIGLIQNLSPQESVVLPFTIAVPGNYTHPYYNVFLHATPWSTRDFFSEIGRGHIRLLVAYWATVANENPTAEERLEAEELIVDFLGEYYRTTPILDIQSTAAFPSACSIWCDWLFIPICAVCKSVGPLLSWVGGGCVLGCTTVNTILCYYECENQMPEPPLELPECPDYLLGPNEVCPDDLTVEDTDGDGCIDFGRYWDTVFEGLCINPETGLIVTGYRCAPVFIDRWWDCGETPNPNDPNEKASLVGQGPEGWAGRSSGLQYRIYFENQPTASGPAFDVSLSDGLSETLDLTSFRLGNIHFGSTDLSVPVGSVTYQAQVMQEETSMIVEVTSGIDVATRNAFWLFRTIDPMTGQPPTDAFAGFLPPEDGTGRGQGWVEFTVRPENTIADGTIVSNEATITFDFQEPLITNMVSNSIDNSKPSSLIQPLPMLTLDGSVSLSWTADDQSGSGLSGLDFYVSIDGGTYVPFVFGTLEESIPFSGMEPGKTYSFYSRARDLAGNFEEAPLQPDAITSRALTVIASDPSSNDVDARQPSNPDGSNAAGWQSITVDFDGNPAQVGASAFQIASTNTPTPQVQSVFIDGWSVTITFDRPIPAGAWTKITYLPSSASVCLGYLPGDVNGDGVVNPVDILATIDAANGAVVQPIFRADVDRSNLITPADILRVIDLMNGADDYDPWLSASLGVSPCN